MFRPTTAATVLGVVVMPLITLGLVIAGVGMLIGSGGVLGVVACVLFVALAILPGIMSLVMLRGWFSIQVDPTALSLVGLFGNKHVRMPWSELDAVGLVKWRGARFLTVRPLKPWTKAPSPGVARWDSSTGLLLISGVERWSRPTDELLRVVRENAGAKWSDPITEPLPD